MDATNPNVACVMLRHRETLVDRGTQIERLIERLDTYIEEGLEVQEAQDFRVVAINIGVPSEEALETARAFWGAVFGCKLEDWAGPSSQIRLGPDDAFSFLNIRVRSDPDISAR